MRLKHLLEILGIALGSFSFGYLLFLLCYIV